MIKFIKFFFSKLFWINTILAILVLYLLFYFTMHNLDNFTNHGIKIKVPNLLGTHINDVEDSLTNMSLRYQIRDSVYSDFFSMGTVIQQDPKADKKNFKSYVKPNRTIYLTVVKKQESFKTLRRSCSITYGCRTHRRTCKDPKGRLRGAPRFRRRPL